MKFIVSTSMSFNDSELSYKYNIQSSAVSCGWLYSYEHVWVSTVHRPEEHPSPLDALWGAGDQVTLGHGRGNATNVDRSGARVGIGHLDGGRAARSEPLTA